MSRLTKNISDKQTYCGYEIKKCKYQQIYDFKKYDELEDYVDCDLTLAIDKLGKLEDIEEEIGCPLDVVFKLIGSYIILDGNPCHVMGILKDGDNLCIHYSTYYGGYDDIEPVSNYGKTFWIDDEVEE